METEDDKNYVCTLDEASLKYAKKELNEDPKDRLGAVQTLRKWILEQPHLTCPTDTEWLLYFLRARYFSQLESRQLLEGFYKQKTKYPQWWDNLDSRHPDMHLLLDTGIALMLPGRDKEGRLVTLFREGVPGYVDKISKDSYLRFCSIVVQAIFLDESTHVNGWVSMSDFGGMTMKHHTKVSLEDKKNYFGPLMGKTPIRVKGFNVYNLGTFSEMILSWVKMVMPAKLQKRMFLHGTLESLYKQVPMEMLPDEYLPDDYKGPSAGPIKGLIESTKKYIMSDEVHDRIAYLSSPKFKFDKSKRQDDIPQASFRKLNID